ncbi:SRPBCC family protein [Actinophytocola sp. NPDC049390]|uniref:SRPBCC family protein n=1 Tax=Actinophytocola sp. NPDC049390 TaxID=3363894 RepID=UPI0037A18585
MAELKIWTTRQRFKVAALPKRVYELVTDITGWPSVFDSVAAVEPLGTDRACERFRIVEHSGSSWISVREVNQKRLQVRYRRLDPPAPLRSMAGLWRVETRAVGVVVALDHYFSVADDDAETAARAARQITAIGTAMLDSLRRTAELGAVSHPLPSGPDRAVPEREAS